ncbi:MAG: hypothetical protein DMF37_00745 [Verrucomicrobia bacterium]|nr:MAG: hypothetical protein DMF37_00745 [Verrucomicrobiota bacterium]
MATQLVSSEPVKLQHPVEILRRNFPKLLVRLIRRSIEVTLVQLPNCGRRILDCDRGRLKNFVIKRDRELTLRQASAD